MAIPPEINHGITIWSTNSISGHLQKNYSWGQTEHTKFIAAWSIIHNRKNGKQPKHPWTDGGMNQMWSMEYYAAFKKEGKLTQCHNMDEPWRHEAEIRQSKIGTLQENKYFKTSILNEWLVLVVMWSVLNLSIPWSIRGLKEQGVTTSFWPLLDRNCAAPSVAGNPSRGTVLSDLTWEWSASRHTPEAFWHKATELCLQLATSLLRRLLVTCPQMSPTQQSCLVPYKMGNKTPCQSNETKPWKDPARAGTRQVSPCPIRYASSSQNLKPQPNLTDFHWRKAGARLYYVRPK